MSQQTTIPVIQERTANPITRFVLRFRSELLLFYFVLMLLLSPLADQDRHAAFAIAVLVALALLAGVSYMARGRIVSLIVLPIAGVWFVARWVEIYTDERYHIAPIIGLVLSCAVIWGITSRFGTVPKISTSVISEAIIVYLVIAVAFSQVYWIMNRAFDHCFNVAVPLSQSSTLLYFSLVTITTVGYGGVAPVNPYVRLVAGFEAVVGLFYISIAVARLVAAYRPSST